MNFSSKLAMTKPVMNLTIKTAALLAFTSFAMGAFPIAALAEDAPVKEQTVVAQEAKAPVTYITVQPLDLVANPQNYLNKAVRMEAIFHKFSMLGLDYDRAMRSSKDYISMLIKRPGVPEQYTIPLSEMKLILKRDLAEKLSDLESGDRVVIKGKVFSTALKDPWVDVFEVENLDPDKKEDEEDK